MHAPVRYVVEDLCNSLHGAPVHGLVSVLRAASMWSDPLEAGSPDAPKLGVPHIVPAELLVRQGDVSRVGVRRPVAVKALLEQRSIISVQWLLLHGLRPHVSERRKRHVVGEGEDCSKGRWAHGLGRAGGLGFGFGFGLGLGLKELGSGEDGGVRGGDGCGCGGGEGGQRLGGDGDGGGGGDGGGEGKGSGSGSGSGLGSGSACARVAAHARA